MENQEIKKQEEDNVKKESESIEDAIKVCFKLRALEMKAGYFNTKKDSFGNITSVWIPDTRKTFISSVEGLICLFNPEILRDKETKEAYNKLLEKKKELFDKYAYDEKKKEKDSNRIVWKANGNKFIPEIKETVCITTGGIGTLVVGGWDSNVNTYWNEMLILFTDFFSTLNILYDNLKKLKARRRC